jgi:hypothetical protein
MASITIRRVATAALVGTATALVVDAVLQNALNLARLGGRQYLPWWVTGNVLERGPWLVAAALLWIAAPRLAAHTGDIEPSALSAAAAWKFAARVMIVAPAFWLVASVIVRAIKISLTSQWAIEGPVFLDSSFYASLSSIYVPWLAGGLVVGGIARHLPSDPDRRTGQKDPSRPA